MAGPTVYRRAESSLSRRNGLFLGGGRSSRGGTWEFLGLDPWERGGGRLSRLGIDSDSMSVKSSSSAAAKGNHCRTPISGACSGKRQRSPPPPSPFSFSGTPYRWRVFLHFFFCGLWPNLKTESFRAGLPNTTTACKDVILGFLNLVWGPEEGGYIVLSDMPDDDSCRKSY